MKTPTLFKHKYIDVHGSKMAYIDEGNGEPILFIHGVPNSSHLWRNIIPYVLADNRAIAVDLIGMGKSDKPKIEYNFDDHVKYLEGFIEKLKLKNITLVLHDWGSALGFNYAMRNENNIKAIIFMESMLSPGLPALSKNLPPFLLQYFQTLQDPIMGPEMMLNKNAFFEAISPENPPIVNTGVLRKYSEEEMVMLKEPYPDAESRKPLLAWPNQFPVDGKPENVYNVIVNYTKFMLNAKFPKLMLYASPGLIAPEPVVDWVKNNVKNVAVEYVGEGIHEIQEDQPDKIGNMISEWMSKIKKTNSIK